MYQPGNTLCDALGPYIEQAVGVMQANPVHNYCPGAPAMVYAQGSAVFHCPDNNNQTVINSDGSYSYILPSYYQDKVNYGLSYEWDRSGLRAWSTGVGTYGLNPINLLLSKPKTRTEYLEVLPRPGVVRNSQVRASSTVRLIWDFDSVHAPPGILGERNFYYCDGHVDY